MRRLRGEAPADDGRHQIQRNRPKRAEGDDQDDGPTYVVEESNDTLSKAEYEALVTKSNNDAVQPDVDVVHAPGQATAPDTGSRQKIADGTLGSRKRKVGVKVGLTDEEEKEGSAPVLEKAPKKQKKPKKKAIALSFDGEE